MSSRTSVGLGFPRARRVKRASAFVRIKAEGRRLSVGCLTANWMPSPSESGSRLGVVTTRRLGSAVIRTRARRLLREAFRLHQHELQQPVSIVLVARNSILDKGFQDVERDYLSALRRAKLLKEPT